MQSIVEGWVNWLEIVFVCDYCPILFNLMNKLLIRIAKLIPFLVKIFPMKEWMLNYFGCFLQAHVISSIFHYLLQLMDLLVSRNVIFSSFVKLLFNKTGFLIFWINTVEKCLFLLPF